MIKGLRDFYFLDGKLLYASKDFIGFNPTISKGLIYNNPETSGIKIRVEEFEMQGDFFKATLTSSIERGPLRGFRRIEIVKNERPIIHYERGGKGHGSNYSNGNYFLVENNDVYLVAEGYAMIDTKTNKIYSEINKENYYFFWFRNVVIPTKKESIISYDFLKEKENYSRNEIEHLRQTEWYAKATLNNNEINISKSSIPGFWRKRWNSNGYEEFGRTKKMHALSETKILVDGIIHLYEK